MLTFISLALREMYKTVGGRTALDLLGSSELNNATDEA